MVYVPTFTIKINHSMDGDIPALHFIPRLWIVGSPFRWIAFRRSKVQWHLEVGDGWLTVRRLAAMSQAMS